MSISVLFALLIPCSGFIKRTGMNMNYDLKVYLNKQPKDNTFSYIKQSTLALPVWPVYGGVIAQLSDWIFKKPSVTDEILDKIGGRVVPMTLGNYDLSPFLLLAHHCHSFTPLDPIRGISNLILSEGFPAHPHSGFSTVTYCIDGGLKHRDSEGTKMTYGNGDVQWMRAGRGTIHEEMWDTSSKEFQKIEIFQLWVNLPSHSKTLPPKVTRILSSEIPVFETNNGASIKMIAGSLEIHDKIILTGPGNHESSSAVSIMHIKIPNDESLSLDVPMNANIAMYVRRGSVLFDKSASGATTTDNSDSNNSSNNKNEIDELASCSLIQFKANKKQPQQQISQHQISTSTATSSRVATPGYSTLNIQAGGNGVDVLLLIGEPLNEPVVWQGPLVQANMESWQESANAFNALGAGGYWDHKLSDSEWKNHVQKLSLQQKIKEIRRDLPRSKNEEVDLY